MKTLRHRMLPIFSMTTFCLMLAAAFYFPPHLPSLETSEAKENLGPEVVAEPVALEALSQTPQELALADGKGRLSEDFVIPTGMESRVAFWLDIYTKYDSHHYIVHHREYPWIIFDIANTTDVFSQDRVKWLNRRDADSLANSKKEAVLATLKMLAVRANYDNLPTEEARIFALLEPIPGPRRQVIRDTLKAVRIQLGQKDLFVTGLVRSGPFIQMMEEIFLSKGLPKELVRLPLVESSFNIEAHSRVGARGAWQIMPNIGKKGLRIDPLIDERESPLKSTQFAAFILKQNKNILKTWPLAVTAYNHGSGSLLKAVRKLKTSELQDIIDQNNERSFQFASSNFYACFMAALRGELYAKELFPDLLRPNSRRLTKVVISKNTTVGTFAKQRGLALEDLEQINPELPNRLSPRFKLPAGFHIYVPLVEERPAGESRVAVVGTPGN